MSNTLFISLGSAFNPDLETGFGFIKENLLNNNTVLVVSIDVIDVPDKKPVESENLSVARLQYRLKQDPKYLQEFIEELIPNIKTYDKIIICDGIHTLESPIGNELTKQIEKFNKQADVKMFHFISPLYESPTFNRCSFDDVDWLDMKQFILLYHEKLLQLFKNPKDGERILKNLITLMNKPDVLEFNILQYFLDNAAKKLMPPENIKKFRENLTEHIVSKINNSNLSFKYSGNPRL